MIQTMLKRKFGEGGVQICEEGSISASGFGPGGSKSAVTPETLDRERCRFTCSNEMLGKKCRYFTIESKQANKHRDLQNLLKLLSCRQLA